MANRTESKPPGKTGRGKKIPTLSTPSKSVRKARDQIIQGDLVHGDKIMGDKVNIQIGTLQIGIQRTHLILFGSLLGAILLSISGLYFFLLKPDSDLPSTMSGTFNIAIASFTDQFGESSEEGYKLATWIYEQIRTQQPSFPPGSVIEVWGPEKTGSIKGSEVEQQVANANKKSGKIGAHILIYGSIASSGDNLMITPNFYLSESGFENAQEVTGIHQMGDVIRASSDLFRNPLSGAMVNRELSSRVIALSHFTVGLVYLALEEYSSAYQAFQQAEQLANWRPDQGKEVVYLFLGNAALGMHDFTSAHAWFESALKVNPDYSRAFLGKGFTYYQESILPLAETTNPSLDLQKLDLAIISFQNGLTAPYQPPLADVPAKANFGLGRAHLTQSWYGHAQLWSQAENELLQVTTAYEQGQVHYQELAAQAYGQLGLLYYILKVDDQAINAFKRALEIGTLDEYKKEWATWLSKLYAELGDKASSEYYYSTAESYSR